MQKVQRSKEAAQFEEWERQEDNFHLDQARLRSHIRIQDGRGKILNKKNKKTNEDFHYNFSINKINMYE